MELPSESFSLVAEEVLTLDSCCNKILDMYVCLLDRMFLQDSGDLRNDGGQDTLKRITKLVNDTLSMDGTYNITVSEEDVLAAIDSGKSEGGPSGQHWVLDPIDGTKG